MSGANFSQRIAEVMTLCDSRCQPSAIGLFVLAESRPLMARKAAQLLRKPLSERCLGEVRRINLLLTSVNKGRRPEPNNGLGSLVTTLLLPTPHCERAPLILSFLR